MNKNSWLYSPILLRVRLPGGKGVLQSSLFCPFYGHSTPNYSRDLSDVIVSSFLWSTSFSLSIPWVPLCDYFTLLLSSSDSRFSPHFESDVLIISHHRITNIQAFITITPLSISDVGITTMMTDA